MTQKEKDDFSYFWDEWMELMGYAKSITTPDENGEQSVSLKNSMMVAAYAIYLHEQRKNKKAKNRKEPK